MSLFVYTAQSCIDDAISHGCKSQLEKFAEDIEREQRINRFSEDFPYPYLVKKQFTDRNRRLIADQRDIQGHLVVCLLRIMIRGDDEYEKDFQRDPKGFGERKLAGCIDTVTLEAFVSERTEAEPPDQRPEPSEEEYLLLNNALSHNDYDKYICESEAWCTIVSENEQIRNRLILFPPLLRRAIEEADSQQTKYVSTDNSSVGVVCRWFPRLKKLFLIAPFNDGSPNQKTLNEYESILESLPEMITEDALLKQSVRAYPDLVLYGDDGDMWLTIQKDDKANMALSPEESDILESVVEKGFPLFINGRAGSGKSTLLQYLFAEYLTYYFEKADQTQLATPLFFTCNKRLLESSRRQVLDLVEKNHRRLLEGDGGGTNIDAVVINNAFQEFHEFLYKLLPPSDTQAFSLSNYVDYAIFKKLWSSRYAKDPKALGHYGPDISWHIIRTYIKGISSDDFFEPNDYGRLSKKERTVTLETYKLVFDQVWSWYSKECEEKGNWDDQDLVRRILDSSLVTPKHPAIFCDEAQDFTKIELELIFRLNLYSDRAIPDYQINKVPFVFAGDPFQTLNPTGFRWEAIKASFVNKFIHSLTSTPRRGNEELNYQELRFNYRSNANIVKFCNTIQAIRSLLFNIKDIQPQNSWQYQQTPSMPVWFDSSNSEVRSQLKEQTDLTIIVPCLEGEESQYVSSDQLLKDVVNTDEAGIPQNVFSASRVKGLEYNRIVLYGFGKQCCKDGLDISGVLREGISFDDPDKSLPVEYFLNRLYVAASRPKKQLIIIDSADGMRCLWDALKDESFRNKKVVLKLRKSETWAPEIGGMMPGYVADWTSENKERPEKLAEKYEEEGVNRKDSNFLRSAAMYFQQAGDEFKSKECKARALDMEGAYFDAGNAFNEIDKFEDALSSFWKAREKGYSGIKMTAVLNPDITKRIEFKIINILMLNKPDINDAISALKSLLAEMEDDKVLVAVISDPVWQENISKLISQLMKIDQAEKKQPKWQALLALLLMIAKKGIIIPEKNIALIHFRAGNYQEAVTAWENSDDTSRDEYHIAKAKLVPFPQNIESLSRLDQTDEIISQHQQNKTVSLSANEMRIIAKAYLKKKQYESVFILASEIPDPHLAFEVLIAHLKNGSTALIASVVNEIPRMLIALNRWSDCISFADNGKWPGVNSQGNERKLKEICSIYVRDIQVVIIKSIARSTTLQVSETSDKKLISDYFDKAFKSADSWTEIISVNEAGAAVENAGRIMSAIKFYEQIESSLKYTKDDKKFAALRWVKCKERLAHFDMAKSGGHETTTSARHMKDAITKAKELKVKLESIPELPDLSEIKTVVPSPKVTTKVPLLPPPEPTNPTFSLQERISLSLTDRFKIDLHRGHKKFKIEQIELMDTLTVDINKIDFSKSPIHIVEISPAVYEGQEWGIKIDFSDHDKSGDIKVSFADIGVNVCFTV